MVIISPKTDHNLPVSSCISSYPLCMSYHSSTHSRPISGVSPCLSNFSFSTPDLLSPPVLSRCSDNPPQNSKPPPYAVPVPYFLSCYHLITVVSIIHRSCVTSKVSVISWVFMDTTQGTHKNVLKYILKNGIWSVVISISISLALIMNPLTPMTSTTRTWRITCTPDPNTNLLNYEPNTILKHDHINFPIMKIHVRMETNG